MGFQRYARIKAGWQGWAVQFAAARAALGAPQHALQLSAHCCHLAGHSWGDFTSGEEAV